MCRSQGFGAVAPNQLVHLYIHRNTRDAVESNLTQHVWLITDTLDNSATASACTGARARWRCLVLLGVEDLHKSLSTVECLHVASAGGVIAAPALVALLYTRKATIQAIAANLPFWNSQGCVSAGRVHVCFYSRI
jgi:hypothetical protein